MKASRDRQCSFEASRPRTNFCEWIIAKVDFSERSCLTSLALAIPTGFPNMLPLMPLVQVCVQNDSAVFFAQWLEHDLLHFAAIRNELFG